MSRLLFWRRKGNKGANREANGRNPALALEKYGFFGKIPARRRHFLESKLKSKLFRAGAEVISQGEKGDYLGILEHGRLEIQDKYGTSRTLRPGGVFGEEMLRDGSPSRNTVTARSDAIVWILLRSDWHKPSPSRRFRRIRLPRVSRAGWIAIISTVCLAMFLLILGPSLLDYANNTVPDSFLVSGRPDLAENYLEFALRLQPRSARLHGIYGDILAYQEKDQEAISAYQQALEIDEFLPWIHNNLGVLLLEEGKLDEAVSYFRSAIDLDPTHTAAYRNLGNAYYDQQIWEDAAKAYQNALDLDFSLVDTKAAWAGLILQDSRLVEARLVWEDVLLYDPRHPLALQGLGVVALLEGEPGLAILYLDAARYIQPKDPIIRLFTGLALEELERPDEAAAEYQQIITTAEDPELADLAETLLDSLEDKEKDN
jgi:Flp pilus assembly protein TadD